MTTFVAPTTTPAAASPSPERPEPARTAAELTGDIEWYLLKLQDQPVSALTPYVDDFAEAVDLLRNVVDKLADQGSTS